MSTFRVPFDIIIIKDFTSLLERDESVDDELGTTRIIRWICRYTGDRMGMWLGTRWYDFRGYSDWEKEKVTRFNIVVMYIGCWRWRILSCLTSSSYVLVHHHHHHPKKLWNTTKISFGTGSTLDFPFVVKVVVIEITPSSSLSSSETKQDHYRIDMVACTLYTHVAIWKYEDEIIILIVTLSLSASTSTQQHFQVASGPWLPENKAFYTQLLSSDPWVWLDICLMCRDKYIICNSLIINLSSIPSVIGVPILASIILPSSRLFSQWPCCRSGRVITSDDDDNDVILMSLSLSACFWSGLLYSFHNYHCHHHHHLVVDMLPFSICRNSGKMVLCCVNVRIKETDFANTTQAKAH